MSFQERFKGKTTIMDKSGIVGIVSQKGQSIDKSQVLANLSTQNSLSSLRQYDDATISNSSKFNFGIVRDGDQRSQQTTGNGSQQYSKPSNNPFRALDNQQFLAFKGAAPGQQSDAYSQHYNTNQHYYGQYNQNNSNNGNDLASTMGAQPRGVGLRKEYANSARARLENQPLRSQNYDPQQYSSQSNIFSQGAGMHSAQYQPYADSWNGAQFNMNDFHFIAVPKAALHQSSLDSSPLVRQSQNILSQFQTKNSLWAQEPFGGTGSYGAGSYNAMIQSEFQGENRNIGRRNFMNNAQNMLRSTPSDLLHLNTVDQARNLANNESYAQNKYSQEHLEQKHRDVLDRMDRVQNQSQRRVGALAAKQKNR